MSSDWAAADYYALLEVTPEVDPEELKRAYRRMAQIHHPDANPGDPDAAKRFQAVARAYAALSEGGQKVASDRETVYRSRTPNVGDLPEAEDLDAAAGAVLGRHIVTPLTVPLEHVVKGAAVMVEVPEMHPIAVDIPPGVEDGDIVRIEGKGRIEGGVAGDVLLILHIPRHPYFERDGDDLTVTREVNVSDLALGTTVSVPTLHGTTQLIIPPGTQPGAVFELESFGVRHADGRAGALNVRIDVSAGGVAKNRADKGSFSGIVDVLNDEDVEVISTVGTSFNSELHEVVGKVEPGSGRLVVTGEVRRGYRVRGQIIRPALVTVKRQGADDES